VKEDLLLKETVYPVCCVTADEEFLHLPPAWFDFFVNKARVRSARAVSSWLRAFPTPIMFHFGMDMKQVRSFHAKILWTLRGFILKSALVKRKRPQLAYGAIRPPPR
jgi:hypothetical protein